MLIYWLGVTVTQIPENKEPGLANWEDEIPSWATRAFKHAEKKYIANNEEKLARPKLNDSDINGVKSYREYKPETLLKIGQGREERTTKETRDLLLDGRLDISPEHKKLYAQALGEEPQDIVDRIWSSYASRIDPDSQPHPPKVVWRHDGIKELTAYVNNPGFINLNNDRLLLKLHNNQVSDKQCRNYIRKVIAHEIAHILNHDVAPESINNLTLPKNEKFEVLADKLGAIISGNPREYYLAEKEEREPEGVRTNADKSFKDIPVEAKEEFINHRRFTYRDGGANNGQNREYLSSSRQLRMLRKWAMTLEEQGAADRDTGEIIDKEKALEIYERSKDMTGRFVDTENASYGFTR